MKRLLAFLLLMVMLFLVGCSIEQPDSSAQTGDFRFCSLNWGESWETVQKSDILQDVLYEISENGHRLTVKTQQMEYLGVSLEMVGLVFDVRETSDTKGLVNVFLQFSDENEAALLTKLTQLYGERKSSYQDKNGVENGINPAGWVSKETVEEVLTKEETERYIALFPKTQEPSRIDAHLRSPLASVRFSEEQNTVEFNGNTAAAVKHIKEK